MGKFGKMVFDLDGVRVFDDGEDVLITTNDGDTAGMGRRTFLQMLGGDLWDRMTTEKKQS